LGLILVLKALLLERMEETEQMEQRKEKKIRNEIFQKF
jgi:hypothetical protein